MLQFHLLQRTGYAAATISGKRVLVHGRTIRASAGSTINAQFSAPTARTRAWTNNMRGCRDLYTQRPNNPLKTATKSKATSASASTSASTATTTTTTTTTTTAANLSKPRVSSISNRPPLSISSSTTETAASSSPPLPLRLAVPIGGFAGLISAMTGVGGGMILIPGLAHFTKLPQQVINGTSIGAVAISASVGAMNYVDMGSCNIPLALVVTIPSLFFTRYGVQMAHRLPSNTLSKIVGLAMLLSTPFIVLKNREVLPKFTDPTRANPLDLQFYGRQALASPTMNNSTTAGTSTSSPNVSSTVLPAVASSVSIFQEQNQLFVHRSLHDPLGFVRANAQYVVAGAFAGFLSGLCGLGGGVLMTAYLTTVSDLPQSMVIGTSLLSIVPTAASSAFLNFQRRSMHLPTVLSIGSALTLGVYLTSRFVTLKVDEATLRNVLAGALGSAAIVMIRRRV